MKEKTRKITARERKEISKYVSKNKTIGGLSLLRSIISEDQARYILENHAKFTNAKINASDDKYITKDKEVEKQHFYHEFHDNFRLMRQDG